MSIAWVLIHLDYFPCSEILHQIFHINMLLKMFFITICAVLATTLDLLQWDENKIDTDASCPGQAAHVAAIFQLSFYVLTEIECIHD